MSTGLKKEKVKKNGSSSFFLVNFLKEGFLREEPLTTPIFTVKGILNKYELNEEQHNLYFCLPIRVSTCTAIRKVMGLKLRGEAWASYCVEYEVRKEVRQNIVATAALMAVIPSEIAFILLEGSI
jgi:hypothetical protein